MERFQSVGSDGFEGVAFSWAGTFSINRGYQPTASYLYVQARRGKMAAQFDGRVEPIPADRSSSRPTQSRYDALFDPADDEEFKEWVALQRSLRIVVTGKTGAGKSTLLNGFVGENTHPFDEGHGLDPGTLEVKQHTFTKHNVEVTVWDCPGLQDGTENDEIYLQDMKKKTSGDIDIMLYCISMAAPRFDRVRHGIAMQSLTEVFGRGVWRHTVIVLTFANRIVGRLKRQEYESNMEARFEMKVNEWKEKLQNLLRELNNCAENEADIENIKVVPAGYTLPSLPGRKYWLSSLWMAIFMTLKTEDAREAVLALNRHRFRTDPAEQYRADANRPPPVSEDEFNKEIEDHPIVISPDMEAYFHKVGAEIVAVASIGVVVGATIGGVIAGAASLGAGAPAGAGVGGIIGGGIGALICSLFQAYKHRKAINQAKAASNSRRKSESPEVLITPESTSEAEELP